MREVWKQMVCDIALILTGYMVSVLMYSGYHEPLVYCLTQYLHKDPQLLGDMLRKIMAAFPHASTANSPKVSSENSFSHLRGEFPFIV